MNKEGWKLSNWKKMSTWQKMTLGYSNVWELLIYFQWQNDSFSFFSTANNSSVFSVVSFQNQSGTLVCHTHKLCPLPLFQLQYLHVNTWVTIMWGKKNKKRERKHEFLRGFKRKTVLPLSAILQWQHYSFEHRLQIMPSCFHNYYF